MGKIFSNARKVNMWLGHGNDQRAMLDSPISCHSRFVILNLYWTRAWVLQEIMLARDPIIIIIKNDLIPLPEMIEYLQQQRPRYWVCLPKLCDSSSLPGPPPPLREEEVL